MGVAAEAHGAGGGGVKPDHMVTGSPPLWTSPRHSRQAGDCVGRSSDLVQGTPPGGPIIHRWGLGGRPWPHHTTAWGPGGGGGRAQSVLFVFLAEGNALFIPQHLDCAVGASFWQSPPQKNSKERNNGSSTQ